MLSSLVGSFRRLLGYLFNYIWNMFGSMSGDHIRDMFGCLVEPVLAMRVSLVVHSREFLGHLGNHLGAMSVILVHGWDISDKSFKVRLMSHVTPLGIANVLYDSLMLQVAQ